MTMTAKYAGICTKCQGAIHPGQRIEWTPGKGAQHTDCAAKHSVNHAFASRAETYGCRCPLCGQRGHNEDHCPA